MTKQSAITRPQTQLQTRSQTRPHWIQPVALGLIVLLMYAMTLTSWHSGDDVQYGMQAQYSVTTDPPLHPLSDQTLATQEAPSPLKLTPQIRYFLELPTTSLVFSASRGLKWAVSAVRPAQLTHALAGAMGVVFFFLALTYFLPSVWSFIISFGLASSYAWWFFSTHLDYSIIAHGLSCVLLYLMASLCYSEKQEGLLWRVVTLGVVNALISLYLITGVFLVPVILIVLLRHYNNSNSRFAIGLYVTSLVLTIIILGGLGWISQVGSLSSLFEIRNNLAYADSPAHDFALLDIPKTIYGFAKALITYPELGTKHPNGLLASASLLTRVGFAAWYVVAILVVAVPFLLLSRLYKNLDKHKTFAIGLLVWFFIQLPFGAYWEPTYIKWWTGSLIPWWALVGLLIAITTTQPFLHKTLSRAVCAWIIISLGVNLLTDFLPKAQPTNNVWLQTAYALGNKTKPDDLFISSGNNLLDFYLPFFGKRQTLSYELIYAKHKDANLAVTTLRDTIRATRARGGRVFVYNFNIQHTDALKDIFNAPSAKFERVSLEGLSSPPDFELYEVTGLT